MGETSTPVEVFCCYSHTDEAWLRKLETHLSLLQRQGLISLWHDRLIVPGADWTKSIDTHLETASVILLLVSANFLASDYCYGVEMKRALERQEAGEARVIPILVRPVDWTGAPFAHLQSLPNDAKPLASWRNKETALADVVAGIRRVIVEELPQLSASAPRAALPAIWNIPYPRNPFFLGRETELALVRHHVQAGQATALSQPQAISGLGGIGKTQLALEYAYRYHQDYQVVLWARAESTEALVSSYITIASLLRLPEREAKEQEITVQAVKTWLQTHRGWLLILDNADELTLLSDFLPASLGGHLLLTARATATGRLAYRLEIETLQPEQSALFLLRRAGLITPEAELSQVSQEEQELALQISEELGGLPLALDQAGAYLEETGMDLVSYWQIYQQHRADLLRQRGGLVADHPASVATTWSLSFQQVEEKNPAAADLLRLCAYLAPDAIPEEILTAGASLLMQKQEKLLGKGSLLPRFRGRSHGSLSFPKKLLENALRSLPAPVATDAFLLSQAIESLRAYSLVRRDPKEKVLSIHRLVQAVLQDALEEADKHLWAERAIHAVNAAFPRAKHSNWPQCERLLPHALLAAHSIETNHMFTGEEARRLLRETAIYLKDRARYAEAEPLFLRALYIEEQRLGPEHPDVAYPLNNLAGLYRQQGRYTEAEPFCLRALHIREQAQGPEHPDVAYPLNNLAVLYNEQGRYAEAEPLYLRALHIREQAQGPHHPDTAETMYNLAQLREAQGDSEEARAYYTHALAIREQALGGHHPRTTETRERLIALLHAMGQHEEAAQLEASQSEP
jgi:tetratricopeptide (TPR) repeat protein